ncbi:MAG: histidine kinase, partial [Lachnospiraceae bacterium]|nr:histidine kinase [Lachnospiraceae bacterium]
MSNLIADHKPDSTGRLAFAIGKMLKRITVFTMTVILLVAMTVSFVSAGSSYNSSGVENRPVSVDPVGLDEGFSTVLYDSSNGLPTSEANAIVQTGDGFIWIGSYAGLIRYDGNTFERMDSTGGLTSIKCLYVDSKGRLWIGTNENGVAVMENGQVRQWGKLDGMRSSHTRAITEDPNGTIYVATSGGIAMIDKDFKLHMLEDEKISKADMRDLRIGKDGVIYGTTDTGDLMKIRDGKLLSFYGVSDTPLNGVGSILPDPLDEGKVYLEAPDYKLYHVDLSQGFEILERINLDPLKYILSMEYIDDKMWIMAGNGIGVLDSNGFHLLENLPMNSNVGHVMTDYLGNLWFTSTRQGVMKVVPNPFTDIFLRYDLPEMVVNTTCMYDGKLFVGSDTGLTVLDDKGILKELPLTSAKTASGVPLEAKDLIAYLQKSR